MSYVTELLSTNETIKIAVRQHIFGLLKYIWGALLGIVAIIAIVIIFPNLNIVQEPNKGLVGWLLLLLIVPAAVIVANYIQWANRLYIVTNYRVIQVRGVINKSSFDTSVEKINDIGMVQTFWGRIFNFGTLDLLSGNSNEGDNKMENIDSPLDFKKQLLDAKASALGEDNSPNLSLNRPNQDQYNNAPPPQRPVAAPAPPRQPPPVAPAAATRSSSAAEALHALEELRQQGLISEEEYQEKRRQILNRIAS